VEDVVPSTAAKVVVKLAWCASLAAAMVVGASGAVSSCEACIWCSLHRRWSYVAPNLLVVGRSPLGATRGNALDIAVELPF
jgi:hypothetical protein